MAALPFRRVLIANRGEIACRILRTCDRLGLETVAVYSDADAEAQHVRRADQAVRLGPPPAPASYLRVDAVLDAARASRAEAVHPGYGFLSENPELAEACEAAGLVFVGPPPGAIRAMAVKDAAKTIARDAGVPVLPGETLGEADNVHEVAARIGFPLLVKAVAGGGGRGMRRVDAPEALAGAIQGARREALNAFGDDHVMLERFVRRARHVEIQVLADAHGAVLHLLDRDCSLQRRRQKVIEEAPAPTLPPATRQAMREAAVRLARAVGYRGAGTVEFVVDADDPANGFWFLEMNTRLQVEHPVTEAILGLDLVEAQLRIAAGEPLDLSQDDVRPVGYAIEARLCAEDPRRNDLPSPGRLETFAMPLGARVETGLVEGDEVPPFYDNLLAKIVVAGESRQAALDALAAALAATRIGGVASNLDLLKAVLRHPAFRSGPVDTEFLQSERAVLLGLVPAPAQ